MRGYAIHDLFHSAGSSMGFYGVVYGRLDYVVFSHALIRGCVPHMLGTLFCPIWRMWRGFVSYGRHRITTMKLPFALVLLPHTCWKIQERPNRDGAHITVERWYTRAV